MEWDILKQIAYLHNNNDQKSLREFLKPIIKDIKEGQDLDIIISCVSLSQTDFNEDKEFYKLLNSHVKDMKSEGFREAIRLSLLEQMVFNDA